jgi:hypothetical protein
MSFDSGRRLALTGIVLAAALAACGGSTPKVASAPTVSGAPVSSPATTPAPPSCPTAAKVGAALGFAVPKPIGVPFTGATALPAGASGLVCDYHASTFNVIIEVISNIDPSYITQFSNKFPVAYKSVSGVGDQARSFFQPLGGGKDNEGVVATKGSTLVAITATATPASLAQVAGLVSQLL